MSCHEIQRPRGRRSALVIIGVQQDHVKGPCTVPDAEAVISTINTLRAGLVWDMVVRVEIAHPAKHVSFLATSLSTGADVKIGDFKALPDGSSYKLMPTYCVAGTEGARAPPSLVVSDSDTVISIGTNPSVPVMSAFRNLQPNVVGDNMTSLGKALKTGNVTNVYVVGMGLETVAQQTAIDAVYYNFSSSVVLNACKGWSADAAKASMHRMEANGIELLQSAVLLQDNPDRRSEAVAYIEANNIPALLQQLTAELVYHKPDNPREFLIRKLQKRQEQSLADIPRVSLLTDEDLGTMFGMLDPIGQGQLSGKQVMQGLKGLGLKPADPVAQDALFDVAAFKKVVMSAY